LKLQIRKLWPNLGGANSGKTRKIKALIIYYRLQWLLEVDSAMAAIFSIQLFTEIIPLSQRFSNWGVVTLLRFAKLIFRVAKVYQHCTIPWAYCILQQSRVGSQKIRNILKGSPCNKKFENPCIKRFPLQILIVKPT
jgi:hypothetical protein